MKRIGIKHVGVLAGIYLIVLFVQNVGGYLSMISIQEWYHSLNKSSLSPPDWIFGPAWGLLYILMTIAIWIVYISKGTKERKKRCYGIFSVQLVVNFFWTIFFFGMKSPLLGFIDIIVLDILLIVAIWSYYKVSGIAAALMIPYLLWVLFATTLNLSILVLN